MVRRDPRPQPVARQALRRRCEALARALPLPDPFELPQFCADLAARRGRPIILLEWAFEGRISGLLVDHCDADYVFVERDTTPLHQQQIAIHELAHLICGHHLPHVLGGEAPPGHAPDPHGELIRRSLRRGGYRDVEEREAELLASLLVARIAEGQARARRGAGAPEDAVVARVRASLADDAGSAP